MSGRLFQFAVAMSGWLLLLVLVLWPRSCFFTDQWWVRNTGQILLPEAPPTALAAFRTGMSPNVWTEGAALSSHQGLVILSPDKFVSSFFSGRIKTRRPHKLQRLLWLPEFGIAVPYWCIALAAAILPAIWLARTRAERESRARFRFGVRGLLALTTVCALILTGYVHLGGGGVILVGAALLAAFVGVVLWRRPAATGRVSVIAHRVFGTAFLCVALYHAHQFVDCYLYYRAWAPYNSMDT
jgi:hypothetical protein